MITNFLITIVVIVVVGLAIFMGLDMIDQEAEAQEVSPWVVVQEDLVPMGRSRLRFITLQNKVTGKCYLTKDSIGSGFTPVDCPKE